MPLLKIIVLAIVQGLAELLPVSSSAHVVVAEKLMGLDPSSPPMTLLLVMLHTGTMLAVIAYFWPQWRATYFRSARAFRGFFWQVVVATFFTALISAGISKVIERTVLRNVPHAQIEDLFGRLEFMAPALAAAGVLILIAAVRAERRVAVPPAEPSATDDLNLQRAGLIGAVQGLCLPFRGFSRSGATISTRMLLGVATARAEAFSFALAVVITPAVVARETLRLIQSAHVSGTAELAAATLPSLLGAVFAFLAGLLALRWLSRWLESGRWHVFGIYCLVAAVAVMLLHRAGY